MTRTEYQAYLSEPQLRKALDELANDLYVASQKQKELDQANVAVQYSRANVAREFQRSSQYADQQAEYITQLLEEFTQPSS